ncbi:MAG: hypothetical protein QF701_05310 [Nitrospinota bacterium]|nr:hypothetical protein [Nitrospinota bacterium]MDP6366900.1 hypothetical protein [Nitrospinota bacterium]MDP7167160.1 hypothetical protein [Nitrospinota bacterium]MDP7370863.1 hypothetical protein [Nitrospinota bacterium]MDP7662071.1 hypothetical protein [Nitrospinota bacterium]
MKNAFDRIVWTVIAAALTLIALNPWIGPGRAKALSRITDVNIRKIAGYGVSNATPIRVVIVGREPQRK